MKWLLLFTALAVPALPQNDVIQFHAADYRSEWVKLPNHGGQYQKITVISGRLPQAATAQLWETLGAYEVMYPLDAQCAGIGGSVERVPHTCGFTYFVPIHDGQWLVIEHGKITAVK
jgi:hypothetical protein